VALAGLGKGANKRREARRVLCRVVGGLLVGLYGVLGRILGIAMVMLLRIEVLELFAAWETSVCFCVWHFFLCRSSRSSQSDGRSELGPSVRPVSCSGPAVNHGERADDDKLPG
jgi:hypothetical protein